jgi:hypothetical protein
MCSLHFRLRYSCRFIASKNDNTEESWKSAIDGITNGYGFEVVLRASRTVDPMSWRKADAALSYFLIPGCQDAIARRFKFSL